MVSTSRAWLFPGQGAQVVGMGKDLAAASPAARAVFDRANAVLGFDLAILCFAGPEDQLNRTDVSQPAILAMSLAVLEALRERGKLPAAQAAAGLSLGEYTALVAAGALTLEDGVRLVRRRGEFMQMACELEPSGMASILGLDRAQVEAACAAARAQGVVVAANLLGPGQIAISGAAAALAAACAKAKELGAKRAIPLRVAGAFHSPLMAPAADRLRAELDRTEIRAPRIPVVTNVGAAPVSDPAELRAALGRQITSPVLWEDSMRRLGATGFTSFLEIGPGRTLSGLAAKIVPGAATANVDSVAALEALQ
ncbi:MAG: ACP S-malonyltransferase [Planctomycetes bacterium]|nr:ACP S-malonyltransferase [Planctomycetota bacterium]